MGESGCLADDDPDPGTPVASARQLLYFAVVEEDRRARAVLGEDLREVASSTERFAQHALEDRRLDEVGGASCR